jgi:hypothetical protein
MRNKFLVIFNLVIVAGWGRDKALRSKEGGCEYAAVSSGL